MFRSGLGAATGAAVFRAFSGAHRAAARGTLAADSPLGMSSLVRTLVSLATVAGTSFSVACSGSSGAPSSPDTASSSSSGSTSGGGSSGGGSGSSSGSSSGGVSSSGSSGGTGSSGSSSGGGTGSGGDDGGGTGSGSSGGDDAGPSDGSTTDTAKGGGSSLDPNVAPGGNFDLSLWELQEPVGEAGAPTTILPAKLEGAGGFQSAYFFTDTTDGSMTFWDPEDGVTTANSDYPRSELREMTSSGAAANWMPTGTNTLSATVMSTLIPSKVCVGQIHLGTGTPSSTKPLLELYYYATGAITLGIEATPAGGNETEHPAGNVALGTKWSYVIGLSGNTITLVIDGGATQTYTMSSTFDQEGMYFKAGDYDQTVGTSTTIGAKVQFYALAISHGP
jgi:hypothetical protein